MKYEIKYLINQKEPITGEAENFAKFVEQNKSNLSNANLSYADLRHAKLSYADLSYADLRNADLRYTNLRNADFRYVILGDADLRHADLSYADLRHANLSNADLSHADLSYADLLYADLSNADLCYADLRNADINYTGWQLSCKTYNVTVDKNIAAQIAMHVCWLNCNDEDVKQAQSALRTLAMKCRHWKELP